MKNFALILNFMMSLNLFAFEVAIGSAPSDLSPFFGTDSNSQNINRLVHLSLTDFNQNMEFECRLCTEFSEKIENGKHKIIFKLKKNITFWDGTPLKAIDVKKSHKYFTEEKKIKSLFRFAFKKIEKVNIVNDFEVELVYSKFWPDNLSNLSLLKIVKIPNYEMIDKVKNENILGAGPYKYSSILETEINLTPSKDKKRASISFLVVKDETTLALKLINSEIDLSLLEISPRKVFWLRNLKKNKVNIYEVAGSNYKYLGINHKNKFLREFEVRHALSLLIPRKLILKHKLKNMGTLSKGFFSKAFKPLYDSKQIIDHHNPELAKKIFKKIGFSFNEDKKLERNGELLEFKWMVSNNKSTLEMANTIKSEFESAGITIHLLPQEWGAYMKSVKRGFFDLIMGQWIGFTGGDMLNYVFHSSSFPPKGANRGYYKNLEFDKILDEASLKIDNFKRNQLYKKADKLAYKDYAYISLWHPNILWISRKCLENIFPMSNGSFLPLLKIRDNCGKR